MLSPVRVRQHAVALVGAILLIFTMVAGAFANATDPAISASTSGLTATVSGSWSWPDQNACDDRWVGWAVDWDDPDDPGNALKNGFSVGTASDNSVHTNQNCGSPN